MNRILDIGFKHVGNWYLNDDILDFNLKSHSASINVLYAFICNDEIKYIGKTTQQLKKRLYGYKKPVSTQSTNINNNKNIQLLLSRGESVNIFILPDNGLWNYGGFSINLAAGLEDSLISSIKPKWNGGNEESNTNYKKIAKSNKIEQDTTNKPVESDTTLNLSEYTKISVKLGIAYYNQGFINIPVKYSNKIGAHREEIKFFVNNHDHPIIGYINRTANTNGTPRLMGGKRLKESIMQNFAQGQVIEVVILTKQSIFIHDITN